MSPRRMIAAVPLVFCLMALLAWSGCTERPKKKGQPRAASTPPEVRRAKMEGCAEETELKWGTSLQLRAAPPQSVTPFYLGRSLDRYARKVVGYPIEQVIVRQRGAHEARPH